VSPARFSLMICSSRCRRRGHCSVPRCLIRSSLSSSRELARPLSAENALDLAVSREIIPNAQKITRDQTQIALVGWLREERNEGSRGRRRLDRQGCNPERRRRGGGGNRQRPGGRNTCCPRRGQ